MIEMGQMDKERELLRTAETHDDAMDSITGHDCDDNNNDCGLNPESSPLVTRTLDDFLDEAYGTASSLCLTTLCTKWQYWMMMLSLGIANSSDASEILCLSYVLSDDYFQDSMIQSEAWRSALLASSVFFGMLVGGVVVGALGDYCGRHPMLVLGLCCNSVAGVLSALAQNVWQLSVLRCIAGLGIGATVPPLFTLVTELAPPSKRGMFITFCASFWMVGSIYVALTAIWIFEHLHLSWRVFAAACAIPSAIGAFTVQILVPESPRFLAMNQRQGKALRITNLLAQRMNSQASHLYTRSEILLHYPIATGRTDSSSETEMQCLRALENAADDFVQLTSTLYKMSLRRTTLPLQTIWFSLNFGSYGILTWINSLFVAVHLENPYFNALLFAISNLPGNLVSGIFMDYIGRTSMLVTSSLAAAASLLVFAFFASEASGDNPDKTSTKAVGIVVAACCFQAFSIVAWNTIDCMTSERFPTSVRSTGMGVCAATGRIGAMFAQIVNGSLIGDPARLLVVASISLVISAMTPFWLPSGDYTNRALDDDISSETVHRDPHGELARLNGTGDAWDDNTSNQGYQHFAVKPIQIV